MTTELKQSTAVTIQFGPFLDATDGDTEETALTITQADVKLSKNGAVFAQKNDATSATYDALGHYRVPLDATDTNTTGILRVAVHEAGALIAWQDFSIVTADYYDAKFAAKYGGEKLLRTTIATLTSQTSFTLTAGPGEDDALNGATMIVRDSTNPGSQFAWQIVADYVGSTKTVTLKADPAIYTMAVGDFVEVLAVPRIVDADVNEWNGAAVATPATAGYPAVTVKVGTAAGELNIASGVVEADAVKISGSAAAADSIEANIGNLDAAVSTRSTLSAANVNSEVVDVLKTDTISEMTVGAPPTNPTFEQAVMYLYMALANKNDITSTLKEFHNAAGSVIWKKTLSDDTTTYSEAKGVSGP